MNAGKTAVYIFLQRTTKPQQIHSNNKNPQEVVQQAVSLTESCITSSTFLRCLLSLSYIKKMMMRLLLDVPFDSVVHHGHRFVK